MKSQQSESACRTVGSERGLRSCFKNQDTVSRGSQINMEVKFPQLFQWVGLNQDELQVKNRNEAFFSFYKIKKFLELNFFVHFRQ